MQGEKKEKVLNLLKARLKQAKEEVEQLKQETAAAQASNAELASQLEGLQATNEYGVVALLLLALGVHDLDAANCKHSSGWLKPRRRLPRPLPP